MAETEGKQLFEALSALGLPTDDSMMEQMRVLAETLRIYNDRRARYGDSWKLYGWLDSIFHMRNKFTRVEAEFWTNPPETIQQAEERLDNAIDLIVYTVFFIRNVRTNNQKGRR